MLVIPPRYLPIRLDRTHTGRQASSPPLPHSPTFILIATERTRSLSIAGTDLCFAAIRSAVFPPPPSAGPNSCAPHCARPGASPPNLFPSPQPLRPSHNLSTPNLPFCVASRS